MRTLFSIALVALIYFMHVHSDVHSAVHSLHQVCCPGSTRHRIRDEQVMNVAHSNCSHKAIIVKTVCNKDLCLDAGWPWAVNLLDKFRRATADTNTKSPFGSGKCGKPQCPRGRRC